MSTYRFATAVVAALLASGMGSRAYADGLAQQFNSLFGPDGLQLIPTSRDHLAHFSSSSQATLGLLLQQLAPGAADFPAVSTVPGLSYRYNTDLQAFERSSGTLGPVFVERPQTIGRGKLDVGFSYLFQDFDELDGASLDGLFFRLPHGDCCGRNPTAGNALGTPDGGIALTGFTDFEVELLTLRSKSSISNRMCCRSMRPTGSRTAGT